MDIATGSQRRRWCPANESFGGDMALKHRVVQRVPVHRGDAQGTFDKASAALGEWLASRRGAPALPKHLGSELIPIGGDYTASRQMAAIDGFEVQRWRIRVGDAPHTYDTRVTLALHPDRNVGWLQYDIDASRDDSAFTAPKLTSVLTRHLGSTTADSVGNFSEGLRVVRKENVGAFLDDVLNNPDRTVTAFVTGSRSWTDFQDRAFERRFSALHGVATFWRLADDAIDEFNTLVQAGYQVYPGSVHVFQPNLDTEDPLDARRHWWYSAAEVSDTSETGFWMRLHTQAMRSALHQPLPAALQIVDAELAKVQSSALTDLFSGEYRERRRDAIARLRRSRETVDPKRPPTAQDPIDLTSTPAGEDASASRNDRIADAPSTTSPDDVDSIRGLLEDAEALLGLDVSGKTDLSERLQAILWAALDQAAGTLPSTEAARREVEEVLKQSAHLQTEVNELSTLLALADEAYAEAQGDLQAQRALADQQRRRADHLADELARVSYASGEVDWEVPEADPEDPVNRDAPTTVDQFFAQLEALPAVHFTGNRKSAERIASAKLRSVILADAWTFACELELYARQWRKGVRGMRRYAEEKSARITPSSFAPDESSDVKSNTKFSTPRTLPVPLSVDASGSVFMGAHFRLSHDNGKAMRMHVYDAVDVDGKIYIGYIGEHLPSRLTT
ncbi:hypothetical protein AB1K56_11785 [Microbacterium sp. BWR-S6Y]|uniref:hypothetical protein n=1 Tax=Microbacterium sp. BWR-S6Y TaxID=3232073 RepID=UPI00352962E0